MNLEPGSDAEKREIAHLFAVLTTERKIPFPSRGWPEEPTGQGVYVIYNAQDKVLHVGRT